MEFKDMYESVYMTATGVQLRFQYDVAKGRGYLISGGLQIPVESGNVLGIVLEPLDKVWLNLVSYTAEEYKFMRDTHESVRG